MTMTASSIFANCNRGGISRGIVENQMNQTWKPGNGVGDRHSAQVAVVAAVPEEILPG